jgi:hypothetical protein
MQLLIRNGDVVQNVTIENLASMITATVVLGIRYWCGETFVLSAPHQRFCSDPYRNGSFHKGASQDRVGTHVH